MSQQIEYESVTTRSPLQDIPAITAGLKFVGYGLLFVGGAILTGTGIIAEAIRPGPGALVALAGAALCGLVLLLLFLGAAARK